MAIDKFFSLVLTAFIAVAGIVGIIIGICTATAHNIVFGAMALSLAYVNHKVELKEDIK